VAAARKGVEAVSLAFEMYKLNNDSYPESLNGLAEQQPSGGSPLLKAKDLTDPWGRPYAFDQKGTRNKGEKVDVWSKGPDPKDPKGVIGNWQEK
jgi:general secretion pathway protein G